MGLREDRFHLIACNGIWVRTGRADLLGLKEFDLIICNPFNKLPVEVIFFRCLGCFCLCLLFLLSARRITQKATNGFRLNCPGGGEKAQSAGLSRPSRSPIQKTTALMRNGIFTKTRELMRIDMLLSVQGRFLWTNYHYIIAFIH